MLYFMQSHALPHSMRSSGCSAHQKALQPMHCRQMHAPRFQTDAEKAGTNTCINVPQAQAAVLRAGGHQPAVLGEGYTRHRALVPLQKPVMSVSNINLWLRHVTAGKCLLDAVTCYSPAANIRSRTAWLLTPGQSAT